jgi:hypothetical protein
MQIEKTRKFLMILSLLGRSGTHFFLICSWLLGSHGHQGVPKMPFLPCSISSKVCNVWQSLTRCSLLYWPLSQLGSPLLPFHWAWRFHVGLSKLCIDSNRSIRGCSSRFLGSFRIDFQSHFVCIFRSGTIADEWTGFDGPSLIDTFWRYRGAVGAPLPFLLLGIDTYGATFCN